MNCVRSGRTRKVLLPWRPSVQQALQRRRGPLGGVATAMFLTAATFAKAKSKYILVRMLSEAGTNFAFNIRRKRLQDKLVMLRYDPLVKARVLFREQKKIRSL
ncbi:39S ribosomal protein L33, mitochondrial [Hemicordylus capensis]|uniref:39S ribosomal protein L33, mitochondrial n=1 Tax=Hemicordylus capensis TaxID=884348 RepID=UPI0023037BE2|nr:39S ribosomal protein L33, mitochondrial [Hemicordylus capensis]